jgi:hypothetical protein
MYLASIGTYPDASQLILKPSTDIIWIAMGIMSNYELSHQHIIIPGDTWNILPSRNPFLMNILTTYLVVLLVLNVLLTLMIVARLYLHNRRIRRAIKASERPGGPYMSIATMLVESCALYSINLMLLVLPWACNQYLQYIFLLLLYNTQVCTAFTFSRSRRMLFSNHSCTQVIAPFLIVLRVAKRREFSSDSTSGSYSSIRFDAPRQSTGSKISFPTGAH